MEGKKKRNEPFSRIIEELEKYEEGCEPRSIDDDAGECSCRHDETADGKKNVILEIGEKPKTKKEKHPFSTTLAELEKYDEGCKKRSMNDSGED